MQRLRGERKFDSVEALRSQLEADRGQVEAYFRQGKY